jgi:hypothetical protein
LSHVGGTSVTEELCGVVVLVALALGFVAVFLALTLAFVVLAFSLASVFCSVTGCEALSYVGGTSVVEDCGGI